MSHVQTRFHSWLVIHAAMGFSWFLNKSRLANQMLQGEFTERSPLEKVSQNLCRFKKLAGDRNQQAIEPFCWNRNFLKWQKPQNHLRILRSVSTSLLNLCNHLSWACHFKGFLRSQKNLQHPQTTQNPTNMLIIGVPQKLRDGHAIINRFHAEVDLILLN